MILVKDSDGNILRVMKRKNGIRKYAARHHGVNSVSLDVRDGFHMTTVFNNATFCRARFERYSDMLSFTRNWRAAQGRPLVVNGQKSGIIEGRNAALI